jgi:hypothetical protein
MRHRLATVVVLVCAGLCGACAPLQVNAYVPSGTDLSRYRTYAWAPDDELVTGDPRLDHNTMFGDHLQAAVDRQFASKGLTKAEAGAADLVVHYHASVEQRLELNEAGQSSALCTSGDCRPFVTPARCSSTWSTPARSDSRGAVGRRAASKA